MPCGIEQTTGHAASHAGQLESLHAQHIHAPPASAAKVDRLVGTVTHPQFTPSTRAPELGAGDWAPAVARPASASGDASTRDRAFIALQNAYRAHGGLSRLQSLSAGACVRASGRKCDVADLVAEREVFAFQWYGAMWIPLFQFVLPGPMVAAAPRRVVAELGRDFDGWALASWFVESNAWLANQRPIECLTSRLPDVLEAARADRFAMTG